MKFKKKVLNHNPFLIIVVYYVIAILIGTILLKIPLLFNDNQTITWLDSFFMSNSAIATTGLVTYDFTQVYNYLGWSVLIVLFNIGGMGIIVINTVIILFIGKKIGFKTRMLARLDYNQTNQINIVKILKHVVVYFLIVEFICTIFVFFLMLPNHDSLIDSFMNALFLISSAVSGSGFYNTVDYNTNYYIQFFVIIAMIFSFIGYPVVVDFHFFIKAKLNRTRYKFSTFTKIAVWANAVTVLLFALIFFVFEYNNVVFQDLHLLEKIQWSFYMSISTKSVGLNLFSDINDWSTLTLIFHPIFMLIGGSPSSACGGIRIGAIYIIYKHLVCSIRGKSKIKYFGYYIPDKTIIKAYFVSFLYVFISFISTIIIYLIDSHIMIRDIWYDVVSGFTTTGFSTGAINQMSDISIFLIAILMGIGRIGIMNIISILSVKQTKKEKLVTYLEKDITI